MTTNKFSVKWGKDRYCNGCVHYVSSGNGGRERYCCNYIEDTGKARSLICKPGKGCTVKEAKRHG